MVLDCCWGLVEGFTMSMHAVQWAAPDLKRAGKRGFCVQERRQPAAFHVQEGACRLQGSQACLQ